MFPNNTNSVRMLTRRWLTGVIDGIRLEGGISGPRLTKVEP